MKTQKACLQMLGLLNAPNKKLDQQARK